MAQAGSPPRDWQREGPELQRPLAPADRELSIGSNPPRPVRAPRP